MRNGGRSDGALTEPNEIASSPPGRPGSMKQLLRTQWDGLASLIAATLLTILSVLDILSSDLVATATLGVLALLCFTMIRTNVDHNALTTSTSRLESAVKTLSESVRPIDGLRPVPHHKIGPALLEALSRTKIWRFKGGTGTYLRAETLPRLALSRRRLIRKVWIEVVDPQNLNACREYSEYRRKQPRDLTSHAHEEWRCERVQIEAYATIIAALWYASNHHMMINLALSSTMSSFRFDMSSDFIMITNEEWDSTALRAEEGSNFYDRYEAELELSFKQARPINLTRSSLDIQFDGSDVRRALGELLERNMTIDFLSEESCDSIAVKAISESHAAELGMPHGAAHNPYT